MRPDAARRGAALAALFVVAVALSGCAVPPMPPAEPARDRGFVPPPDAEPRPEPRSKYGNGPVYEVFGETYTVLASGSGYRERGVASWYGKKFHGRLTSNREPYDMYAMTAAHKSLPLPTYVRVRNLKNDKTVIVRVNDRGPFAHNRIIDLSYAAAMRLDMVEDGTSLVEVTAITFDAPAGDRPVRAVVPPEPEPEPVEAAPTEHAVYAQIGAFGRRDNAQARLDALHQRGIGNAFMDTSASIDGEMYRVRVGPIVNVDQFDVLVEELQYMGIPAPYLVTD
ncbi:MAG: septal ring lytic transglycosylase RlpA family protein [Pseudomonadota bacterium]